MSLAEQEFAELDLGDARRNRRLVRLAETFARQPQASIPSACGGWAETNGAYRFFGSESVDWLDILQLHWDCTRVRMSEHPVGLCLAGHSGRGLAHCSAHALGTQLPGLAGRAVFRARRAERGVHLAEKKGPKTPPQANTAIRLIATLVTSSVAKATANPASRPSGSACSGSPTSRQDCDIRAKRMSI